MLTAGHYHTLTVRRISDHGLYLGNEEGDEVLLPNRFVSLSDRIGDRKEVFVYHDSEDRLVATTERPLEAVDKTVHGAFLDWGIPAKHLFLPNRNQQGRIEIGKKYVVYVYSDNITGRAVATTYLKSFVDNAEPSVAPRDETDILVALESPIGFRVVVNDRHWGMIYRNQIFRPVHVGDRMKAYVTRITEDNRIDLSLQKQGYDEVKESAERLLELLRKAGGTLPLGDDSAPDAIHKHTGMSKKTFKRSAGRLFKQGIVILEKERITLK